MSDSAKYRLWLSRLSWSRRRSVRRTAFKEGVATHVRLTARIAELEAENKSQREALDTVSLAHHECRRVEMNLRQQVADAGHDRKNLTMWLRKITEIVEVANFDVERQKEAREAREDE